MPIVAALDIGRPPVALHLEPPRHVGRLWGVPGLLGLQGRIDVSRCGPGEPPAGWMSALDQCAVAALLTKSATASGWLSMTKWEPVTEVVSAPARSAMAIWASFGIALSSVAIK